jgi:hypothetical protein
MRRGGRPVPLSGGLLAVRDHGQDGEEPEDSGPLPGGEDGPDPAADADGTAQGLYVCLPAEELTLAGFAQDGTADTMAPGPLLATVVHAITGEDGAGLKGLSGRTYTTTPTVYPI